MTDSATTNEVYTATTPIVYVNTALSAGTPTATNSIIDVGQYTTLISAPSGGTLGYSYQWSTHSDCSSPIGGATSSSYSTNPSSTTSYYYNVIDSATIPTSACSAGKTITVNSALGTPTISPSSATYDTGQAISLTATQSGGTTPYTYQWYNASSGSNVLMSGKTSSTLSLTAGASATAKYMVSVTDNVGSTSNSIVESYTINNAITDTWTALHGSLGTGTTQTLTANAMSGTPSYTYNILVYNAIGSLVFSSLSGSISTGNIVSFTQNPTWGTGSFMANLIIKDSATTPNTITNSITYAVGAGTSAGAITPSSPLIDNGQSITLSSNPTGGTTPYTYQWYAGSSCSGSVLGTSSTYSASPSTTTSYVYNVIDNLGTFACSSPDSVTVATTPTTGTLTFSNAIIDIGQSTTLSITLSGGTGTFTANFIYVNNGVVAHTATGISSGGTATYTYTPSSSASVSFNAVVADTGTYSPYVIASGSNTLTINTAMSPTISASLTPSVIIGQTEVFTAMAGGGSQSYTYNYIVTNSVTGTILATALHTGVSSSTDTFNWVVPSADIYNTIQANVIITDSATTHVTANSIKIGTISIIGGSLAADSATVTNSIIDNGQSTTLTSNPIGGLPPYSINWFSGAGCTGGVLGTSASLSVSPSTNAVYSYNAIDSVPTAVCSPSSSITVYATPSSKLTFLTGNALLFGFNAIANDIVTGGSGSFTWQWTINNAGVANSMVSPTQTSSSYVYPPQRSYTYNVIFTDTGTTTHYVGSQVSNVLVISQNNQPNNALSFTLIPSYSYNSPQNGYTANTAGQLYNLLNYLYTLNAISYYGINSVSINFGANSVSSGNSIAFTGSPSIASNSMWNIYQNNAITSYNAVVTINDIYGDVLSNTVQIATSTYNFPSAISPQLYLTPPFYSISTYTKINSPIFSQFDQNSFPLTQAIILPDNSNQITILASLFNVITPNIQYSYLFYYNYLSTTSAGGLSLSSKVTDINGFNSSTATTSGDTVLSYNPGSVTLLTSSGFTKVNSSYQFSISAGNFNMKSVNIYWGDGSNSIYTFATPQSSGTFSLKHIYSTSQTYSLTAFSTDNSPNGGAISSTLSNPTLTISAYIPPQVISVTPSTRFNGANDNTENFTFYMQEGSFSLKNMTINWNDGVSSIGHNKTTSMVALSASQMSYTISHTFPLPTAYYTNVTICDIQGICATYPTPITIGQAPLSQNSIGSIYNDTARRNNQTALNNSATIQENINPTETYAIGAIIFSIGVISVIYYFRVRKRGRK